MLRRALPDLLVPLFLRRSQRCSPAGERQTPISALRRSAATPLLVAVAALCALGCTGGESAPVGTSQATATSQPTAAAATATPAVVATATAPAAAPTATATAALAATATATATPFVPDASAPPPTPTPVGPLPTLPPASGTTAVLSVEESPLIVRTGTRLGSIVPRLTAPEGDARYSWRFPEAPISWRPDRPWVLFSGAPVAAPPPWIVEEATFVLMTAVSYHEAIMKHGLVLPHEPVPADLVAVLGRSELEAEKSVRAQPGGATWRAFRLLPYDYGIVAIDFLTEERAHVYGWTYGLNYVVQGADDEGFGPPVWDIAYTNHTLSQLEYDEDVQRWRIIWHGSAHDAQWAAEPVGRGDVLLSGRDSSFLPYYELNAAARRALGVTEFEDWSEQQGE